MSDTQSRIDSWNERISKLEEANNDHLARCKKPEYVDNDHLTRIKKLEQDVTKFLNEEPIIEYRPPFLNGLEFDAFFQKYKITLEIQGSQHRFHSTSWYKDVKKLEDIVNRDRLKRCVCQDNGIFLLEVWYDEKP
ncbi:9281_t:CDS:2 [Diversispora eburnea]|uniref:9281_t:CDS:1 n=1 Tax=Diversispora eburnea TaxID=1213867 RepID=A0A9N9D8M0_9GLOM|nr:9281_t:CDS:2 [Diversispora eburnea]